MIKKKNKILLGLAVVLCVFAMSSSLAITVRAEDWLGISVGDEFTVAESSSYNPGVIAYAGFKVTQVNNYPDDIMADIYGGGIKVGNEDISSFFETDDEVADLVTTYGTTTGLFAGRTVTYVNATYPGGSFGVVDTATGLILHEHKVQASVIIDIIVVSWDATYNPDLDSGDDSSSGDGSGSGGVDVPSVPGFDLFIVIGAIGIASCVAIFAYKRKRAT
ncbi:MAG: hypothetical protein JW891_13955 [Candidatus Lokiarchaeota archaeon]|nr:hypothetical protein [Candidatus Lokiarchaeota archaeon]